tara:strand:+ start:306 stop:800 length:495 start_codon:yes stop_codon:yes gene_type:complete
MTLAGIHHSKGTDNWGTPSEFYNRLKGKFDFKLDACAESWNTKCDRFYSQNENGLILPWESWTWCNPPYSQIYSWYSKAYSEFQNGNSSVILTFARTDTKAFHEFAINATEICFLKGRLRFIDPKTGQPGNTAPSPSMLVIFDASQPDLSDFSTMDARLNLRGA